MLGTLLGKTPEGARPVVACDMTGQHRHKGCWRALEEAGAIKSMFRKDNCIDDGAMEQGVKAEVSEHIVYWNTRGYQVSLKGMTPVQYQGHSAGPYETLFNRPTFRGLV